MKRFTATEKWKDPWFRSLPVEYKAFWLYLCDECDIAGYIEPDMDLASFIVGAPLTHQRALELFKGRVEVIPSGKWHLTKFVQFQHGTLSESNPCHRGVLRIISARSKEGPSMDLPRSSGGPQVQVKVKGKGKGESAERGKLSEPPDLETALFYADHLGLPGWEVEPWFDHYTSNGWKVGRNPMKDWQATMRNWKREWKARGCPKPSLAEQERHNAAKAIREATQKATQGPVVVQPELPVAKPSTDPLWVSMRKIAV